MALRVESLAGTRRRRCIRGRGAADRSHRQPDQRRYPRFPSTLPWATAYANPGAILQKGFQLCTPSTCIAYQPAAAYEALATIAIGVVLLLLYRRRVPLGVIAITYVAAYAISQLIVFEFRASEPAVLLGLRQAQWTSIGVLVIGVPGLYLVWRWTTGRVLRPDDLAETAPEASLEQSRPAAPR